MDKSQLRLRPGFIRGLFGVFVIISLIFVFLLRPRSGPGPANEWALNHCRWTIESWKSASTNSPNFNFFGLSQDNKQLSAIVVGFDLDSLIKTNFVWGSVSNREIVIVCRKEFSDVHKPGFWNSFFPNPAHAVAYSDGTTELISPEQFANLKLDGFVSLSYLATNSEFHIFK